MGGLTLIDALAASGGELRGPLAADTVFRRVEPNPGEIRPGDLFLAVPGERLDGHEFAVVAALRGAAAAVVARPWADRLEELPLPIIVVDAPIEALQRIAAARRKRLAATVVGITGSLGKTSTKELAAAVLSRRFATYRTSGNRNNELGLPLSLLEVEETAEVVVLEMGGAYAAGELELLARIARPDVGVVTNVLPVHLERMGSLEAIAGTKTELVEAVPEAGVAVLNGDDPRVRAMARRCRGSVLTFGLGADNDVRADEVETRGLDGSSLRLMLGGRERRIDVPLTGAHAVGLVLAAAAVGHALGLSLDELAPALEDPGVELGPRRVPGPNGSLLLDDTYNSSPQSVLSALRLLEESGAKRRIAVLGDMLELGSLTGEEHRRVGRRAAEVVDVVVSYGELARDMADEAGRSASFGPGERDELVAFLRAELRAGDLVLLKGSRALRMDAIVDALRGGPPPEPP